MGYIIGEDRNQIMLLPECIDEYITEENSVRVIDAFVMALDIKELGFQRAIPAAVGRPPFDPRDLLKLYLYGYLNKIRSSRKLENETIRNIEVMWLLKKLSIDFKTISDFRKDNKSALKKVFKQFTQLCSNWGLFGKELVAVDGTKIRASNSKRNNFSAKKLDRHIKYIDEKIEEYMQTLDATDKEEKPVDRKMPVEEIKKRIEELKNRKINYEEMKNNISETGETEISTTDKDARLMAVNNNGIDVCYNVQAVTDSKNKLIVDYDVINNPADQGQFSKMAKKAKDAFKVDEIEALADKGYYQADDLKECELEHITTYVSKQVFSNATGEREYYADKFKYDKEKDIYICPNGENLYPPQKLLKSKEERDRGIKYKNHRACKNCPFKDKCTKSKKGREIIRSLDQDFLDIVDERTAKNKEKYRQRQMIVEHPFGTVKRNFGYYYFLTRGLESVKTEAGLGFLAYNFRRALNILGAKEMIKRLATV
jgi:transposase